MEYNKRRFQKANDKKVLHKVKKHWVVMSMALLMAIGGEAVATHVSAHADTANNNGDQNNDSTNTIKERLNQSLVQKQSNNNQSGQQTNQAQLNSQRTAPRVTGSQIGQQASVLHQRIMKNAIASGDLQNNSTQGRTQNVGAENNQNNNANNNSNVSAQSPKNNVKVPKVNHVGNVNKVASDVEANQANVKNNINNQRQSLKHNIGASNIVSSGTWGTAHWTLDNQGTLTISNGDLNDYSVHGGPGNYSHFVIPPSINQYDVKHIDVTGHVTAPVNAEGLFANSSDSNVGTQGAPTFQGGHFGLGADFSNNLLGHFRNVQSIDLSGLDLDNTASVKLMFAGDHSLQYITGLHDNNSAGRLFDTSGMCASDESLNSIDLSRFINTGTNTWIDNMFTNDRSLTSLDLYNMDNRRITNGATGFQYFLTNTNNLKTLILGPHTGMEGDTGLTTGRNWVHVSDNGAQAISGSNFSYSPGVWSATKAYGNWGTATWDIDDNGDLIIHNGTLTNYWPGEWWLSLPIDKYRNDIKHVYFNDVTFSEHEGAILQNYPNLQTVSFKGVNASNCSDMNGMMNGDPNLTTVDLRGLDTSKNKRWGSFFSGDSKLTNIMGLSDLNMNNAIDLNYMFAGDTSLENINLKNFNTYNATHNSGNVDGGVSNGLFGFIIGCPNLRHLTLGPNTVLTNPAINNDPSLSYAQNVNSSKPFGKDLIQLANNQPHPGTWNIFHGKCGNWGTALWSLDHQGNLTLMNGSMKTDDSGNHGIPWNNVYHIETYNVVAPSTMSNLFEYNTIRSVDLSGMNTSNVTDMSHLFQGDTNLSSLNLSGLDTHNVQKMISTFQGTDLPSLDLSNLDTSNVNDFASFADSNNNLKYINLGGLFNTRKAFNNNHAMYGNGTAYLIGSTPLTTLVLGPNVVFGSDGIYLNKNYLNENDYTSAQLTDGQAHPGIWTHNAELLNYMNGNTNEGHEVVAGKMNSQATVGSVPSGLASGYRVVNPGQKVTINGSSTNINVEPAKKVTTTDVKVVYENNDGNESDDNVPVKLTGPNNTTVYFSPVDMAQPDGYQLDKSKTQPVYTASLSPSGNLTWHTWHNEAPTVYFVGNQKSGHQINVRQVIETPNGTVLQVNQNQSNVVPSSSTNVGDIYTVNPEAAPSNTHLAGNSEPNANYNHAVTVHVDNNSNYLSPSDVTFYYVDPAKTTATINYINQNGTNVGHVSDTGNIASDMTVQGSNVTRSVPSGYTYNSQNNPTTIRFGKNNKAINVGVTGQQRNFTVNYVYNHSVGSHQVSGRVGDTVNLPTYVPAGYFVSPGQNIGYLIQPGNNNPTVNVEPTQKLQPYQFIDNNGHTVGTTQYIQGNVGSSVTLSSSVLPKGYTYNGTPTIQLTQGNISGSNPDQMNMATIKLNNDAESVPVHYLDKDGSQIGSGTISGHIGDNNVSLKTQAPSGYALNADQPSTYSFTPDNIASSGTMKPVNVYVHAQTKNYMFIVHAQELTNHKNKSRANGPYQTITTPVMLTFNAANHNIQTIDPNTYTPDGYSAKKSDQSVTVKLTDHGLVNASNSDQPMMSDTWSYEPKQSSITIQYYDDKDDTSKKSRDAAKPLGNAISFDGNVNSTINVVNHDGKQLIPSGYNLDSDMPTRYQVQPENNLVKVYVHNSENYLDQTYPLTIRLMDPSGKNQISSYTKPVTIKVSQGNSQTLKINDYSPNGTDYVPESTASTGNGLLKVTNNGKNGLSPQGGTFVYRAKNHASDKNIQPITVEYINQTGQPFYSHSILNNDNYEGQTINVVSNVPVPQGYQEYSKQQESYTFGDTPQTAQIYVKGDPVNAVAPVQLMHTSSYNPNQNKVLDVPETVELPISGRVGDPISINDDIFSGYLPTGYKFAGSNNTYNNANYQGHTYQGILTPSDSKAVPNSKTGQTQWNSDSWSHSSSWNSDTNQGDPYWYQDSQGGRPLLVLQASDNEAIYFDLFNQNNQLLNTLPINKGNTIGNNGKPYDPSYNDLIHVPDYKGLIPKSSGYYYDSDNQTNKSDADVRFSNVLKHVPVMLKGKPETVNVTYKYSDPTSSAKDVSVQGGSINGHRVGDVVPLTKTNVPVPAGYHLASDQSTNYLIDYNDDQDKNEALTSTGTINRTLKIEPDAETLPVDFVTKNGNQNETVSTQYVQGHIGDTNVKLPAVPDGYHTANNQPLPSYDFTTDKFGKNDPITNNGKMPTETIQVQPDKADVDVTYVNDNGVKVGSDVIPGTVGQEVHLPSKSNANSSYGLSKNYTLVDQYGDALMGPSDVHGFPLTLKVSGVAHTANNLKVNLVYSDGQGNQTATANNVPVEITGQYGTHTTFDPANLAKLSGYTLDTTKTPANYDVTMDSNDDNAAWTNGQQPTIYLTGASVNNKNLVINQVTESPEGMITKVTHTTVPVSGSVGDDYSVTPSSVPLPDQTYHLASGQEPNAKANQPLKGQIMGKIMQNGSTVYLSQPTDTLYYVDPSAKSTVTVHYINQNHHDVSDKSYTQSDGSELDLNSVENNLPSGYQLNNEGNPTSIHFGQNPKDVDINVVGDSASANAEYYDNSDDMNVAAGSIDGQVGDTVPLPTNSLDTLMGYHLAGNTSDYTFKPSDSDGSNVVHVQVRSNQMNLPINFIFNGQSIGQSRLSGTVSDDNNVTIPSGTVPQGYHIASDGAKNYNFSTGTIDDPTTMASDNVPVAGNSANVMLNYVDQDNDSVGTKQINGVIGGASVAIPKLDGYQMDSGESPKYKFTADNIQSQDSKAGTDTMNEYDVYVTGNASVITTPVKIQYENADGSNQGAATSMNVQMKLDNDGKGQFYPSDVTVPDGYTLDGQKSTTGDQLINHAGNAQWSNQEPTVYFKAKSSTTVPHQINVTQIEEMPDGTIVGITNATHNVSDADVGGSYQIANSSIPTPVSAQHFQLSNSDKSGKIAGQVTSSGLTNDHAVLHYVDQKTDNPDIDLHFQIHGQGYDVENDNLSGSATYYGQNVNAMDYLPAGYHLDPQYNHDLNQLIYKFGDAKQSPVIYVQPDQVAGPNLTVHLKLNDMNGHYLTTKDVTVPLNAKSDGSFDIKAAALTKYLTGYQPANDNHDIQGNVGQTGNELKVIQNADQTFAYDAQVAHVPVEFINQNGQYVKADGTLSNQAVAAGDASGYYGQTMNDVLDDESGVKLPQGYSYADGNRTVQLTDLNNDQSNPAVIMVAGNPVNDQATINVTENDPYGQKQTSNSFTEPVSGRVGDTYTIEPGEFTPAGYRADASDKVLTGVIGTNGVGKLTANYGYTSNAATTGLKSISVIYTVNGSQVGTGTVAPQTKSKGYAGDYAGKTVNAAAQSLPSSLTNDYQIVSGQNVPAQFSTADQSPVYVSVQSKAKGQHQINGNATVINKFYDPSGQRLIKETTVQVPESGNVDGSFTIQPSQYTGYTLQNDVPSPGTFTSRGILNNTVYNYRADMSNAQNSAVKPLTVTYQDNDQNVGIPDQRVDGYMGETMDAVNDTELPAGYHLTSDQNTMFTLGTTPQNVTLKVAPNSQTQIGRITVFYRDAGQGQNNKLIDQVTMEGVQGNHVDLSADHSVPEGYQFQSILGNGSPEVTFGATKQNVTVEVDPIVTDHIVYEDIDNDQNQPNGVTASRGSKPKSVGVRSLVGVEGTPIDYTNYTNYLPQGYKFAGFGAAKKALTGGNDVIYVKHSPAQQYSSITVNYVKYDQNGHKVGSDQQQIFGHKGSSFDLAGYEQQLPMGYDFVNAQMASPVDYFTGYNQLVTINVRKPTPKPQYGKVAVHFVSAADPSREVGLPETVTGHDGNVFDVSSFEHEAPEGYNYAGIQGKIPDVYVAGKTQNLYIKVIK